MYEYLSRLLRKAVLGAVHGPNSVDGGSTDIRALDATRMAFKFGCRARVACEPHGYLSWGRERYIFRERPSGLVSRRALDVRGELPRLFVLCVAQKRDPETRRLRLSLAHGKS